MSLSLRVATPDDGAALAAIYAPYIEDTAISLELTAPDADQMAARIASILPSFPWLVAERDGAVIGYAYYGAHHERLGYRWSVNFGVYLAQNARGQGAGKALYRALIALARAQGYEMAFGGITLPNAASVGLHESVGFRPIGVYPRAAWKMGEWRDVGWWGLEIGGARETGEPGDPPAEPVPFSELRAAPGWGAAFGLKP